MKKIKLDNGLRIVLAPQPQSLAATVLVLVEAGSKYETKEINGLSHFLEHMCFKGTTKRPKIIDISGELDTIGAEYNAFTSQESTGYHVKVQAAKFDKALEIVSDLYLNPVFDAKEIDKERGVVIEELNLYEDTPPRKVHDLFMSLLYGDQPAGWEVGGRKEVIRAVQRDDFLKYRQEHYLAQATVVTVAGAFDEKTIVEKIKANFSGIKTGVKSSKLKTAEKQNRPAALVKFKESDQTHLVLGVRGFDIFDERRFALQVMADVLGGGMSSRLFHSVREELGAAYYVNAFPDFFTDHGYLAASAGVDHKKINQVIETILAEFKRLADEEISPKELQRSKDHLTGNTILGLETSDELAGFYGGQEVITGEVRGVDELLKRIQQVSATEIKALAAEIFKNEKLNLAVIGPFKNSGEFDKILGI